MAAIDRLLIEIDRRWKPAEPGKILLRLIGSGALMLQAEYERGTKDGDILETQSITPSVKERLLTLAGKNTAFHRRFGVYIDVVMHALPFLAQRPIFHSVPRLSGLEHFSVEALDIVDVVVSKLRRFNANDDFDIREMASRGLIDHKRLIDRFEKAVDSFSLDARIEDVPKTIRNLNTVERDYLRVPESKIALPDWMDDR